MNTTPEAILEAVRERAWLPEQIERVSSKSALENHPPLMAEVVEAIERIWRAPILPIREPANYRKRRQWTAGRERTGGTAMEAAIEKAKDRAVESGSDPDALAGESGPGFCATLAGAGLSFATVWPS